jgi:cytochrome c biogenesis protein CcdA
MNIHDYISTMQSMDIPLLTAFVLGLLVALNPCQLSINISALSYILKNEKETQDNNKIINFSHNALKFSLPYATGRTITYTVLGWIMMCLIGGGRNIQGFQNVVSKSEILLPYILIAIGLFLLYRGVHTHVHHGDNCHHSGQIIKRNGPLGSLILGMTLALAFCPESAIFYFGIMIPMSMTSDIGFLMPFVFGIAAGIPVVFISWLMHTTVNKVQAYSKNFNIFQKILNILTGILFILIAIFLFTAE